MTPVEDRRRALENRLKELDWKLVEIEGALDAPKNRDDEERATEREGDEVLEEQGLLGQQEERMIIAALDRIRAGTYGTCAKCGDDISEERLDVLPATPLCRNCAVR